MENYLRDGITLKYWNQCGVMVSDGVITGDDKWLEKLIRTWNEGSTQDLAKAVVDEAVKHRKADREDDVTAVAIRITENGH